MSQLNLKGEILKLGYETLGGELNKFIEDKIKFINSLKAKEQTEQSMKRIDAEEYYCKKVVAFQLSAGDFIEELQNKIIEIQKKKDSFEKSATYWYKNNKNQLNENIELSQQLLDSYEQLARKKS